MKDSRENYAILVPMSIEIESFDLVYLVLDDWRTWWCAATLQEHV